MPALNFEREGISNGGSRSHTQQKEKRVQGPSGGKTLNFQRMNADSELITIKGAG